MEDIMHEMMVQQGYVPSGCMLPGEMVFLLMKEGKDPCIGCNISREKCGGRK